MQDLTSFQARLKSDLLNQRTIQHQPPGTPEEPFRLVVVVHFNRGKLYIRHVLTHEDYDRGDWKAD